MSDLLLEVGTEEIPARMIPAAVRDLGRLALDSLRQWNLDGGLRVSVEATPRRLALFAENLLTKQPDQTVTLTGPSRSVAFDADGNPMPAALGFSRRVGIPLDEMRTGSDGKLEAERRIDGQSAPDLLVRNLASLVLDVRFPRSMYWTGRNGPRFIRPIRWIVALLDGQVIPFEIAGVVASNKTWGHRQLSSGPLPVRDAASYRQVLEANGVVLSADRRRQRILEASQAILPVDRRLRTNARLLETLTYETEFPTAILGAFDADYLRLPEEVLETVMLVHQKYFAIEDSSGSLKNSFVAVANSGDDPDGEIRRGHERVLRARFNDARFFWQFDQRVSLEERVEQLKSVTFQAALGSYWDKTQKNLRTSRDLIELLDLEESAEVAALRAVELAKSDLTTEMVGEFPELQGKIGGLYAAAQGESQAVADAIYDHYLPAGSTDPTPSTEAGCLASLADKLSTLGDMFGIGLVPTGSKDPLALRRAAYGAIRIVGERGLPLSINNLVEIAQAGDHAPSLRAFLRERLRHWLQESAGFPADVVQAVLAISEAVPSDAAARATALASVRSTPDFAALAISFKRIRNILEQSGDAEALADAKPDTALLEPGAEVGLHEALEAVQGDVANSEASRDYESALRKIAGLRPALDRYFEEVLVMAKDANLRRNRLTFLARMLEQLSNIADFALIAPDRSGPGGV